MSDYDAFGRKKDEAGLGDLGWGTTSDGEVPSHDHPEGPSPTMSAAESGFSTSTEFRTAITGTGGPARTWQRRRNPFVWFVQLAVLASIGYGIYLAVDAGNDAVDSVRDTFNTFDDFGGPASGSGSGSGDRGDETVPTQVQERKLFTPAGLRSALKVMERDVSGRPYVLSIRRDRINATIIEGNKQKSVGLNADAEVPEVFSLSTAPSGPQSFSYEELNPEAPFRLMKASNARVNRSDADVDYIVAQKFLGEKVVWGIYYKGGSPITQGDSRGRFTRRIS